MSCVSHLSRICPPLVPCETESSVSNIYLGSVVVSLFSILWAVLKQPPGSGAKDGLCWALCLWSHRSTSFASWRTGTSQDLGSEPTGAGHLIVSLHRLQLATPWLPWFVSLRYGCLLWKLRAVRQQNLVSRTIDGSVPLTWVIKRCLGQEHPPSTYAHDAKWCILGIWLSTMIYQFYEAAKAWRGEWMRIDRWIHVR